MKTIDNSAINQALINRLKFGENKKDLFLSIMIMQSILTFDDKAQTAYATLDKKTGKSIIAFNPEFWNKLDEEYRFKITVHELYHLILHHFSRFPKPLTQSEKDLQNICFDLAINQLIEGLDMPLPNTDIVPVTFDGILKELRSKGYTGDFEKRKSAEYYYDIIKKVLDDMPDDMTNNPYGEGEGEGEQGDSDGQGEQGDSKGTTIYVESHDKHYDEQSDIEASGQADIASTLFEERVKEAMCRSGVGIDELGLDTEQGNKIDWQYFLSMFLESIKSDTNRLRRDRKNKRFGWIFPKIDYDFQAEVNVLIDTSGSMSGYLEQIIPEIVSLATQTKFDFYTVDTKLSYVGSIEDTGDMKNFKIEYGGGTDFSIALQELDEQSEGKGIIFITDTWGDFPECPISTPIIILSMTDSAEVPDWLQSVTLDMSEEFNNFEG